MLFVIFYSNIFWDRTRIDDPRSTFQITFTIIINTTNNDRFTCANSFELRGQNPSPMQLLRGCARLENESKRWLGVENKCLYTDLPNAEKGVKNSLHEEDLINIYGTSL